MYDLRSIPFDKLFLALNEASTSTKEAITSEACRVHKLNIDNMLAKRYANREDSYEGNTDEEFPFVFPDAEFLASKQAEARKLATTIFIAKHKLKSSWFLPQLTAYIAKIPLVTTPEGLISTKDYYAELMKDDYHKGIWALCMHSLRGDLVDKQYLPENRNYCALVPLLLMPHKSFNKVKYSSWDSVKLSSLVDPNLYKAMKVEFEVTDTPAELLLMRNKGLVVQTGKTAGSIRNAMTTHRMYALSGEYRDLPWLAQAMLFQIWCAHPVNRSELMILSWKDWDSMPEPFVSGDIFQEPITKARPKPTKSSETMTDSPWDC